MRTLDYTAPCLEGEDGQRIARLVRHLAARLEDFGPGGPEVVSANQSTGVVLARFPGHRLEEVADGLERRGILAAREGETAAFYLNGSHRFEDLDRLWGCLYDILG